MSRGCTDFVTVAAINAIKDYLLLVFFCRVSQLDE